eukprot:Skav220850  [mRNA]  locus=scaffold1888:493900:494244:- [translate_table: standard]
MTIGIVLLRKDKGANPEAVKESEKCCFRDPKLIDKVLDSQWVKQKFQLDEKRKEVNKDEQGSKSDLKKRNEKKKASKGQAKDWAGGRSCQNRRDLRGNDGPKGQAPGFHRQHRS